MSRKPPGDRVHDAQTGAVAVVLKGYPRLSETFIAQEILALERAGLDLRIISLRHPTDPAVHPVHEAIKAPVTYLPEYLHEELGRVLRSWRQARRLPGYLRAVTTFLRDFRRDPTRNRLRRFGQACVLAGRMSGRGHPLLRSFSPHAGLGGPLRQPHDRTALVLLRARQGHLDHAGMGNPGKAGRARLSGDLHPQRPRSPGEPGRRSKQSPPGLPRP